VFACFGNTLGVYFNCDDFLHLPYLYRLFNGEPELFLTNFSGPWVGERSLYLFFRPVTELSLMVDYFFNQAIPFGYHLSNLLWHTANAFVLFLFTKALLEKIEVGEGKDRLTMAIFAAGIFAVFPTHSEAVAWILARADLVSTFFLLLSLYFFVVGQNSKNSKSSQSSQSKRVGQFTLLSLAAFFCSLLSKESAISLPVIVFALSITLSTADNRKQKLSQAAKDIAPYLVAFAAYLVWRFLAIGKLVGGYVGSIGQRLYENYFARWVSSGSLWQLLHPFNQGIYAENHVLRVILRVLYALAGIIVVAGIVIDQKLASRQKLIYFALAFFTATMLPNFQVWGLSSSMSGSRIAYLPSTALALIIVFSIYIVSPIIWSAKLGSAKLGRILKASSITVLISLTITFATVTNGNNIAWLNSAKSIRDLKKDVEKELATLAVGQKLVLFNLPSRVDGAFTFTMRPMLAGLFIAPVWPDSKKDQSADIVPLDYHPNWSIFVNRQDFETIIRQPQLYKLATYDAALGKLVKPDLTIPAELSPELSMDRDSSLPSLSMTVGQGTKSSSYYLKPEGPVKSINPLTVDFLELDVKVTKKSPQIFPPAQFSQTNNKASLFVIWNNRPADQEDQTEPHWTSVPADGQEHKILVELGPLKRWLLSKDVDEIRLDVATDEYDWQIGKPKLIGAKTITPNLSTTHNEDNYDLAPLSEDRKTKSPNQRIAKEAITFDFDASKTMGDKAGAAVLVEVSKPYASFEHYNYLMRERLPSKHALLRATLNSLKGSFTLETKPISSANSNASANNETDIAIYQVHVAALDDAGQVVGTFSDPVAIKSALPIAIK
jgi:hypothetical protein